MFGDSERITGKPEVTVRGRISPDKRASLQNPALLPTNMQAALSGRKARPKCIDEANAGYLITSCMLVARRAARAIST
jgi:hypothetical protein